MLEKINMGLWEEALSILIETMKQGELNEEDSILGATILEHFGDYDGMFRLIVKGLLINPQNYELYLLLGNYYRQFNYEQAYLCYENALYLCDRNKGKESEDYTVIKDILYGFETESKNFYKVNNVSFIILTRNELEYTKKCIDSIRKTCYQDCYEIIVVDNASDDGSVLWLESQNDITLIKNDENKGFPVGCNQGIEAACKDNDIFLLNNDTVLMENSLFWLRHGLYADARNASAGAVTNYASNEQAVLKNKGLDECIDFCKTNNVAQCNPYEFKTKLIMFALLIRREAIDRVGLLDERFTPGNLEDDDYGIRLIKAGYRNVLCHNAFIYHYGSITFEKEGREKYSELIKRNRQLFKEKWGFVSDYYSHVRKELLQLIKEDKNSEFSVLEVGCGLGETLSRIKYLYPNAQTHGIELVKEVVDIGSESFDIIQGNIELMELSPDKKYDYIIFADVLEHLREPESVLMKMKDHLNVNGRILASIPNLMNARIIYNLLKGSFTYEDAGILDITHLRFFTQNEIVNMFERIGLEIEVMLQTIAAPESTAAYPDFFSKLLSIEGVADRDSFDTYQFLMSAKVMR